MKNSPAPRPSLSRTAVLVDLENAAASTIPNVHDTHFVQVMIGDIVASTDAHYIVATGTRSYASAAFGWRGGRVWTRGGEHGAELELLDRARNERLAERFDHIVIVSGDHLFTDYVSELGRLGKTTTVVGWRGSVATSLRLAAHRVAYFDSIAHAYLTIQGADIA